MDDQEKVSAVEVAFELGKLTRRAIQHCNDERFRLELSEFATHLHGLGHERIAQDLLSVFVAGFHEEEIAKER